MNRAASSCLAVLTLLGTAGISVATGSGPASAASVDHASSGNASVYALKIALPTANGDPQGVVKGPSGTVWFTESAASKVGRIAENGTVTEFSLPIGSEPKGLVLGPDKNIWFAEQSGKIGRVTPAGTISQFPVAGGGDIESITNGPDGALWFAVRESKKIGRITTAGTITLFPVTAAIDITDIANGPGGLWFTDYTDNLVGRITTAGKVTTFPASGHPGGLVEGPDGNEWVADYGTGNVDKVTPSGAITSYGLPSGSNAEPASICVGANKQLWVAEEGTNVLARVDPKNPQPSNTYEFHLPQGTGPDAVTDPNGTIVAGGFDGDDIVELLFTSLSASALKSETKAAILQEQDALEKFTKDPEQVNNYEAPIGRSIGLLKTTLDDLGGGTSAVQGDLNGALQDDEAALKAANSGTNPGARVKVKQNLMAGITAKQKAVSTLQAMTPVS